jgi:hypothetical protein
MVAMCGELSHHLKMFFTRTRAVDTLDNRPGACWVVEAGREGWGRQMWAPCSCCSTSCGLSLVWAITLCKPAY